MMTRFLMLESESSYQKVSSSFLRQKFRSMDKHAPAKQKTVIMRPNTLRYNDEVDGVICARRQLERA